MEIKKIINSNCILKNVYNKGQPMIASPNPELSTNHGNKMWLFLTSGSTKCSCI